MNLPAKTSRVKECSALFRTPRFFSRACLFINLLQYMTMLTLLKTYWFASSVTLLVWLLSFIYGGPDAFFTVAVLTLLEITFSADNAVVNGKVLATLSPFWQKLFLTVGVVIAVFVVRLILPLAIVAVSANLDFASIVDMALHHTHEYAEHLEKAAPAINAFGGTFLLMIALSFFIDYEKETHWLKWLEKRLGKLGRYDNFTTFIMLLATIALFATTNGEQQATVLIAGISAMALHSGLELIDAIITTNSKKKSAATAIKTGVAGFVAFMYLQVLDASFSLDGVIGAFAITSGILLILAGLGAGAVWVRAMTVHLVRTKALSKYVFLEHGAHWAIAFLGSIMLLKLYHVEPPEWVVGSLGLVCIAAAVWWSRQLKL